MEDFFFRVIRGMVVSGVVNPDKVFLTGYSAGGDGIYHMGPRMADTISGAAMMVGHPNHAPMENCRNIIFSIQVGGLDDAYTRNKLAY